MLEQYKTLGVSDAVLTFGDEMKQREGAIDPEALSRAIGVGVVEVVGGRADGVRAPRVLILTAFDLDELVHDALRAGASGFLLKDAGPAELLAGIRAVHSGEAVVAPSAEERARREYLARTPRV